MENLQVALHRPMGCVELGVGHDEFRHLAAGDGLRGREVEVTDLKTRTAYRIAGYDCLFEFLAHDTIYNHNVYVFKVWHAHMVKAAGIKLLTLPDSVDRRDISLA